jgi:hypothetical protein
MLLSFVPVPAAFALVRHLSIPFARPLNDPPELSDPPDLTAAREADEIAESGWLDPLPWPSDGHLQEPGQYH